MPLTKKGKEIMADDQDPGKGQASKGQKETK